MHIYIYIYIELTTNTHLINYIMYYIVWFGIDGKLNRFNQIYILDGKYIKKRIRIIII